MIRKKEGKMINKMRKRCISFKSSGFGSHDFEIENVKECLINID